MERRANRATKETDVTSAAEETLQFDDSNLRGENLKYYFLSVVKYQRQLFSVLQIPMYKPLSPCQLWGFNIIISQNLDKYMKLYQIRKLRLQCSNLVSGGRNL